MANENEKKPRDKGLGEYAKDFVGGLFGQDDDDKTQQQGQQAQQQSGEERPHDKGLAEYTKDFVSGLFGRDDDDDKTQQPQAPAAKPKQGDQSIGERLGSQAQQAAEQARQQAQQKQQGGSFVDQLHETVRDAAGQAQQKQQGDFQTHSQPSGPATPGQTAPKPASQANESELERLRNRVSELEHELGSHQAAPAQRRTYTVVPGDSLRAIAQRHYGDEMQWKRIYEANRGKISNPDLIHPGQVFEIPE